MAHGPYWEDLPVDANGRRYVVPTKWNQLVANILNWQADRDAGGYALNNLGSLSVLGNVGIGTESPSHRLHVVGAAPAAPSLTYHAAATGSFDAGAVEIAFGTSSDSPWPGWIQVRQTGGYPWLLALNPSGGNVGIGTESPLRNLHVAEPTEWPEILLEAGAAANAVGRMWGLQIDSSSRRLYLRATNADITAALSVISWSATGVCRHHATPVYADNAAAIAGGLAAGDQYRTSTGVRMEVY